MSLPKNMIIVEDEAITQRFLLDIFAQHNINNIVCFDNAADTLEYERLNKCDFVLMDINIKGPMDGIQLSGKILEKFDIPIVFITAHNDPETVEETLELSPYGFICKPFTSRDVIISVQMAYNKYLKNATHILEEKMHSEADEEIIISKKFRYSKSTSQLYRGNDPIGLTKNQHALVTALIANINQTVSSDVLVSTIWEDTMVADSALRTLVYSVRKLMPDFPINSYSKVGYVLKSNKNGV